MRHTWLIPVTLGAAGAVYWLDRRGARASGGRTSTYWAQLGIPAGGRAPHVEALARIIVSEAGGEPAAIQRLIAWVARNRSLRLRRPMHAMGRGASDSWGPITAERPMSTSRPATPAAAQLARDVLSAPQPRDVSGGATHIFHRGKQDRLYAAGQVGTDAAAVIHIWTEYHRLRHVQDVGAWTLYGPQRIGA